MISEVKNIDCIEGMKAFPDKFFDLAIVDPPYGSKKIFNGSADYANKFKQYDNAVQSDEYFNQLFRISKNQIIWGGNYFNLPPFRCFIIWDKDRAVENYSGYELAWSSFDNNPAYFKYCNNAGFILKPIDFKIHPTQKPVALYKWLLHKYAKPNDKILDTHLGSGSHRIAAYNMGFDFWGFELDKDYYEAQEKRFKEQTAQLKMFAA